ncbi:hypothetical protein ColLi_03567 [Colletotrichum liriopes]|uniref:Uncharacterized protein n=1 Tax=Colletotrichum liriopes TaxID=708192 RepID=A0AA37GGV6_9PEZI|nr:hypothetical protein ColLi_03567 [Colletotrichum liriopes]
MFASSKQIDRDRSHLRRIHIHPALLALGGVLLSSTTAAAQVNYIGIGLPVPTDLLAERPRQNVKGPNPKPTSSPETWDSDTDTDVRGQENETCGYFSTDGGWFSTFLLPPSSALAKLRPLAKEDV